MRPAPSFAVLLVAALCAGCGDSGSDPSPESHEHPPVHDDLGHAACHGLEREATVVDAALDHEGAEHVVLTPGETTWLVRLPDGAPGYVSLMLPTDHTDWALFVDQPGVVVSLTHHDGDRFDVVAESPNPDCADEIRVDARIHIHAGGPYLVELSPDGAREILVQVLSGTVGHGDDGGDDHEHGDDDHEDDHEDDHA